MLIKDPYLQSHRKENELRSVSHIIPPQIHNISTQSQPVLHDVIRNRAVSSGEVNELKGKVKSYENELRNMEEAYRRQEEAARKMLSYNEVNREYHEAMRARNYELNVRMACNADQIEGRGGRNAANTSEVVGGSDAVWVR